jgi:exo-1,4-beta-D-glucosaminidase
MLPKPESLSDVYFVELTLSRNDEVVSRNVYWLARKPDVLDWDKSNWFTTPTQRYADLTALQKLPTATIEGGATTHRDGGTAITTVTLSNPADASNVALFEHVSIRRGDNGNVILPVYWDRNDVTLWPGESVALTARYPAAALKKARPTIRIGGWNTKSLSIRGNGEPE